MAVEFIAEIVIEIIGSAVISLIELPGATIHWLWRKKQLPFAAILEHHFWINFLLSLLVYGLTVVLVFQFLQ